MIIADLETTYSLLSALVRSTIGSQLFASARLRRCESPPEICVLYVLYILNALLMIALPLAVAHLIRRRWQVDWGLFGVGAATFVLAQVLHVPFNSLLARWGILPQTLDGREAILVSAVVLGLSAGVFEEVGRYLAYRFCATDARDWASGMMLGAGHGGIEALILGFLAFINFLFLAAFRSGRLLELVPVDTLPLLRVQLDLIFSAAWYDALLGFVERIGALTAHLALSIMVLQVFLRRKLVWLLVAILFHALLNGLAVFALATWGVYAAEAAILLMALIGTVIIWRLYTPPKAGVPAASENQMPRPVDASQPLLRPELTSEKLDESRYS